MHCYLQQKKKNQKYKLITIKDKDKTLINEVMEKDNEFLYLKKNQNKNPNILADFFNIKHKLDFGCIITTNGELDKAKRGAFKMWDFNMVNSEHQNKIVNSKEDSI